MDGGAANWNGADRCRGSAAMCTWTVCVCEREGIVAELGGRVVMDEASAGKWKETANEKVMEGNIEKGLPFKGLCHRGCNETKRKMCKTEQKVTRTEQRTCGGEKQ